MARYTGPKHKLSRREGVNLSGKMSQSLERRLTTPPGSQGRRGRRKVTEYGIQLREKQKLKRIYGLLEKQFARYVEQASREKGNTEEVLLQFLESRLDNIVYRMGFAHSRSQARQYVSHGHVLVNDQKINIPSYKVKEGDVVALRSKLAMVEVVKEKLTADETIVDFVKRTKDTGKVLRMPTRDEVANPVDYALVIEFYSR
ncbi:MAG TPA: 30S ribosomal protein S4 [Candidatus Levybacteria bacterium]|nr:30S ribosomal protein S4 [Candidatus Levybacteria bacterium]